MRLAGVLRQELEMLQAVMPRFSMPSIQDGDMEDVLPYGVEIPPSREDMPMGRIPRIRFDQAKALVAEYYHRPMGEKEDLEPEEEDLLCQYIRGQYGSAMVFVTHYPTAKRPFLCHGRPGESGQDPEFRSAL